MNVTEIPTSAVRPDGVPAIYTVRENDELFVISYEVDGDVQFHCDMNIEQKNIDAAVKNLGSMVFEKRHPGAYMRIIKQTATGQNLSDEDRSIWQELIGLGGTDVRWP